MCPDMHQNASYTRQQQPTAGATVQYEVLPHLPLVTLSLKERAIRPAPHLHNVKLSDLLFAPPVRSPNNSPRFCRMPISQTPTALAVSATAAHDLRLCRPFPYAILKPLRSEVARATVPAHWDYAVLLVWIVGFLSMIFAGKCAWKVPPPSTRSVCNSSLNALTGTSHDYFHCDNPGPAALLHAPHHMYSLYQMKKCAHHGVDTTPGD